MTATDQQLKRGRRGACCSVWAIVLIGMLPILIYVLLVVAGGILIVGDPLRKADVVVLLGGGESTRMEEAVRLYKEKYASLLVLSETGEVDPESGIPYVTLQKEEALNLGMPEGGIVITPKHGNSTYEEAVAVRKMLTGNDQVHSIIVVTDPFHTLRTRLLYQEAFSKTNISVIVRPASGHWYRSTTWWQSRMGWELTIAEYAKIFAFFGGIRKD